MMHFGDDRWSAERPTEPGWYWIKQQQYKRVVRIWRGGKSGLLCVGDDGVVYLLEDSEYDGVLWWTEKLTPPVD